ncbi:MAG: hypothetical protein ACHRXM_12695 [Isosphaerales bacterium]
MDAHTRRQELERIRAQIRQLEAEVTSEQAERVWHATSYYTAYYATAGFLLGIFGAIASLLFNVIGAPIAGKTPLELIRVYLTFPLGERALQLTGPGQTGYAVGDGVILAFGCCLYLATGMLLGIPVYLALARFAAKSGLIMRLAVASVVSLAIWGFNFYAVLSWLQPLLIGGDPGNWITNPSYLPWWVAAATHLVFGWTIALLYPLGEYAPYRRAKDLKAA